MTGRKPGSKNKNPRISNVQLQNLIASYKSGLSTITLGAELGVSNSTVSRWLKKAGVARREKGFPRGEEHPGWVGGRHESPDGYVRVWVPGDSPFSAMAQKHGASNGGYTLEHRMVVAVHLGRPLTSSETVHHIDGDKMNNVISNLQLRQGRHGKGAVHHCGDCGSTNIVSAPLS